MPYSGMSFDFWRKKVDSFLLEISGMDSDCLPDYDYYSAYLAGDTPLRAALDALEAAESF